VLLTYSKDDGTHTDIPSRGAPLDRSSPNNRQHAAAQNLLQRVSGPQLAPCHRAQQQFPDKRLNETRRSEGPLYRCRRGSARSETCSAPDAAAGQRIEARHASFHNALTFHDDAATAEAIVALPLQRPDQTCPCSVT
jgi:hypothetical protein